MEKISLQDVTSKLLALGYEYKHISTSVDTALTYVRLIKEGKLKPLLTRSEKENNVLGGLFPSELKVLAGRTGTGKTAKIIQDMEDYVTDNINPFYDGKIIILYDSWEMPDWRNVMRFMSRATQLTTKEILNYKEAITEERYERIKKVSERFKGYPIYISNHSTDVRSWGKQKMHMHKEFPNHQIVNIGDHTRLVSRSNEGSEMELLTRLMGASMKIKNITGQIFIWLSQLNREIEKGADREKIGLRTPILSDIFGSDAVNQNADQVVVLHRPGMSGKLETFDNYPTGVDLDDPSKEDNLLIQCILKNREGHLTNLICKHQLAYNLIEDYDLSEIDTSLTGF